MEDRYKFFRCGSNRIWVIPSFSSSSRSNLYSTHYRYSRPFAFFVNNATVVQSSFSGVLSAMSAMVNLEIPWINIMSKMDLVTENTDDPGGARNGIRGRRNIAR
jgi:hypothetical protein